MWRRDVQDPNWQRRAFWMLGRAYYPGDVGFKPMKRLPVPELKWGASERFEAGGETRVAVTNAVVVELRSEKQ